MKIFLNSIKISAVGVFSLFASFAQLNGPLALSGNGHDSTPADSISNAQNATDRNKIVLPGRGKGVSKLFYYTDADIGDG
eukprot:758788-Hanusia_phi.AAC.6